MKIKSIKISGMRNVQSKLYQFDKNINYISGENGKGKSTILDAINLAIFGYIPGQSKKLSKIMDNSNGNILEVELTMYNDSQEIIIHRIFLRKGGSVQQSLDVSPDSFDIDKFNSKIQLPLYDFDTLISWSANDQKNYFIDHIVHNYESNTIDILNLIETKICELVVDASKIQELISEIYDVINDAIASGQSDVDSVKTINWYLKNKKSLLKDRINENEKTLSTLVKSGDDRTYRNLEDIILDKKEIQSNIDKWTEYELNLNAIKNWEISAADVLTELDNVDINQPFEDTEEYKDLKSKISSLQDRLARILSEISLIDDDIKETNNSKISLNSKIESIENIINSKGICNYTNETCEYIVNKMSEFKSELSDHRLKLDEIEEVLRKLQYDRLTKTEISIELQNEIQTMLENYQLQNSRYIKIQTLKKSKPVSIKYDGPDINILKQQMDGLDAEYTEANRCKIYDELYDKLVSNKFKYELELGLVSDLIKYTGPNELQNDIMKKPFKDFSNDMSKYVSLMFSDDQIHMAFNISNKSNDFSFGIVNVNSSKYRPYHTLSSGEKCLFNLAFMITLLNVQKTDRLNSIIVDDILDHLDKKNAKFVFNRLVNLTDISIQFIIAGVVSCTEPEVTKIKV